MKYLNLTTLATLIISCTFAQTNTLPTTGNVGIGTLTPLAPLHVHGSSASPLLYLDDGTNKSAFQQNGTSFNLDATANIIFNWGNTGTRSEMRFENSSANSKFYLSGSHGALVNGWGGFKVGHTEKFGFQM